MFELILELTMSYTTGLVVEDMITTSKYGGVPAVGVPPDASVT